MMATISASDRLSAECGMIFLSLKNRMFPIVRSFVVPDSVGLDVLLYSHDRMAKKNAPVISCDDAMAAGSLDVENRVFTWVITDTGTAFCRFSLGSSDLKLASCFESR